MPAVLPWHESKADFRVLSGPNGGGKTTAGAAELVSYACGYNPVRNEKYPTPNITWAVCLTYKAQGRRMLRALQDFLPRHENGKPNWKYWKQEGLIEIGKPYGSEIYIKQQEDGSEAFYGERVFVIWMDEGKAGETGAENFNEMLAREDAGMGFKFLVTLTPENGEDWLWNRVWNEKSPQFIKGTFRHQFSIDDCSIEKGGFWSKERIEKKRGLWEGTEALARLEGKFAPFGFRMFFKGGQLMKASLRCPKGILVNPQTSMTTEDRENGIAHVFGEKERGHDHIGFWDPSSGVGGDNSAFIVLDRNNLAIKFQCARNDMDPKLYAERVVLPASNHFDCLLAVEVNGEAGATAKEAVGDYPNLYMTKNYNQATAVETDSVGWRTVGGLEGTRGKMLDALQRALREDTWLPTFELLQEMSHIQRKRLDTGRERVEAADGYRDDLVFAAGGALAIHYEEPVYEYPPWEKIRVRYKGTGDLTYHSATHL